MLLKDRQVISNAKLDQDAMNILLSDVEVKKFIKYVIKSYTKNPAKYMQQHQIEWEDLYQASLLGLYNGIKKLDLNKDSNEWIRFLYLHIQGEIRSFSRSNQSNAIGISQRIREMYPKYLSFHYNYQERFKRDPTINETMSEFSISRNDAFDLVYGMQRVVSVFQEINNENGGISILDTLESTFEDVENQIINKVRLEEIMKLISQRQQKIIYLHFILGWNKTEIAKLLKLGNTTVQRDIVKAFELIKLSDE